MSSVAWGRVAILALVILSGGLTATGCGGGSADYGLTESTSGPGGGGGESEISEMSLGEVEFLDFGSGQGTTVNFNGDAGAGTFVAVLHSQNIQQGSFSLVLQGELGEGSGLVLDDAEGGDLPAGRQARAPYDDDNPMHALMQDWAPVYAESPEMQPVTSRAGGLQAIQGDPTLGSTESFRVLNTLSSVTNYSPVTGRLRYIGSRVLVYVDTVMDSSTDLTAAQIATLASEFEEEAVSLEHNLFGLESDSNGDGRIAILMTPVLNEICQSSGIVTGFFFPGDLYKRTTANPASNEREIFYAMVPDSQGIFCKAISADFALNRILPGVLAHELQHMISFNQHVLIRGGTTEEPWLNEALSHLTEDLVGHGSENYSRMKLFLDQIDTTTLVPSGSPTLAERGMSFMFLRYLYEQVGSPTAFLNNLLQTSLTGVENIEGALPSSPADFDEFSELLSHWQVTLVMSGIDLTDDSRYNYQPRTLHPLTGNYQGICLYCEAEDGRGTVLSGPTLQSVTALPLTLSMESTGLRFLRIDNPGAQLVIAGSSGAQFGGALISLEDPS